MILLFTLKFLTDFVDFELVFPVFAIISASQHRRIIDKVSKEIFLWILIAKWDCLPNNDPDFDELDPESDSLDERLDLDL